MESTSEIEQEDAAPGAPTEQWPSEQYERLVAEAMALPDDERILLMEQLESSFPNDPSIDEEWLAVARERAAEIESGAVKAIPLDEVIAEMRARYPG
jgi:putative addiction module component (TIGR02574 family)